MAAFLAWAFSIRKHHNGNKEEIPDQHSSSPQ